MNLDSASSPLAAVLSIGGSAAALGLCVYWSVISWRSTPDQWVARIEGARPERWRRWPVYGWLWRDFYRHGKRYLWQARLCLALGVIMSALMLLVFGSDILSRLIGQ
jgi:hypothetical protein